MLSPEPGGFHAAAGISRCCGWRGGWMAAGCARTGNAGDRVVSFPRRLSLRFCQSRTALILLRHHRSAHGRPRRRASRRCSAGSARRCRFRTSMPAPVRPTRRRMKPSQADKAATHDDGGPATSSPTWCRPIHSNRSVVGPPTASATPPTRLRHREGSSGSSAHGTAPTVAIVYAPAAIPPNRAA